ncbi:hypothetical protein D3C81_1343480 [compost metagenome]
MGPADGAVPLALPRGRTPHQYASGTSGTASASIVTDAASRNIWLQSIGIGNTMFAAAGVTLLGLLVSLALAPETRSLSLQEAASLNR